MTEERYPQCTQDQCEVCQDDPGCHFDEALKQSQGIIWTDDMYTQAVDMKAAATKIEIDRLVESFATALKEKLYAAEEKYGWNNGWMHDDWHADLLRDIRKHVEKGDPRDVAAYCAFAWHHGWSLKRED